VEYSIELTPEQIRKLEELTGTTIICSVDVEYAIGIILAEL
jgi:hypothetical protein